MISLMKFLKILLYFIFIGNIISIQLYEQYDIRDHYKCASFNDFRDQKYCKGCWAFAGAETISDRICIDSGGKDQTLVSETELLTCLSKYTDPTLKGCGGGNMAEGFKYWINKGLPTKSCKPFPFGEKEKIENHLNKLKCTIKCENSWKMPKDKGSFYRQIYGEEKIMEEIQTNGPVIATFEFYIDFHKFWKKSRSEIYENKNGKKTNDYHSVKIIGWGSDIINGEIKKYWLCVNSWGTDDRQVFKFIRGIDNCGIESSVITGYKTSKILKINNAPIIALENEFYSFKNVKDDFK